MWPTFKLELLLTPIELITTEAVSLTSAAVELPCREKARQDSVIYIAHFIHRGNSMCFT